MRPSRGAGSPSLPGGQDPESDEVPDPGSAQSTGSIRASRSGKPRSTKSAVSRPGISARSVPRSSTRAGGDASSQTPARSPAAHKGIPGGLLGQVVGLVLILIVAALVGLRISRPEPWNPARTWLGEPLSQGTSDGDAAGPEPVADGTSLTNPEAGSSAGTADSVPAPSAGDTAAPRPGIQPGVDGMSEDTDPGVPPAATTTFEAPGQPTRDAEPPPRTGSGMESAARDPRLSLTIMTWNLQDCAAQKDANSRPVPAHEAIAKAVRDAAVDIFAVQEIQSDRDSGGDMTNLAFALAKAGWPMPYTAIADGEGSDDLAIFSRYRITTSRSILEPRSGGGWSRPGLFATIEADGFKIGIVDLHLEPGSDAIALEKRQAQARVLADFLRPTTAKGIVIIAGDMNTVAVGDRPRPRSQGSASGGEVSPLSGMRVEDSVSTLGYLQLRDDADKANDLFAVNEYLLPGSPTYSKDAHRGIRDHLILSSKALEYLDRKSIRVLDMKAEAARTGADPGAYTDHAPVLLRLDLPLSR